MYCSLKKIFILLNCPRFFLHWLYYKQAKNKQIIEKDFHRNLEQFLCRDSFGFFDFCEMLIFYRMVRNIFYARVAYYHHYYAKLLELLAPPQQMLDISPTAEIGGGLIVQHGYATIIDPRRIGKNCWVNQGVTIGYTNNTDCPTIGDNVTIYSGAKVLGDIHVGNNVVIAANAVVVKDVPDNCIVGGVPARILKCTQYI